MITPPHKCTELILRVQPWRRGPALNRGNNPLQSCSEQEDAYHHADHNASFYNQQMNQLKALHDAISSTHVEEIE